MMCIPLLASNGSVVLNKAKKSNSFVGQGGGLFWTFTNLKNNYSVSRGNQFIDLITKTKDITPHALHILTFKDKVILANTNKDTKPSIKVLPIDQAIVGGMVYMFNMKVLNRSFTKEETFEYRNSIHKKMCSQKDFKNIISKKFTISLVSVLKNKVIISSTNNCNKL